MMHTKPDITEPMQYSTYIVGASAHSGLRLNQMYCMHSMVKMLLWCYYYCFLFKRGRVIVRPDGERVKSSTVKRFSPVHQIL